MVTSQITQICLSHFLCRFSPESKKRKTRDVVREVASTCFSVEKVNEYLDYNLPQFQQLLVEEFNARYANNQLLRFQIIDPTGIGAWVEGYCPSKQLPELKFQDALHEITPIEFEKLSAVILKLIGCGQAFFTPTSHDQGVDAFGYQDVIKPTPYGTTHQLTWIVQAKHYLSSSVSTGDVRQLVGSKELLLARAFSTVDQRYKELKLKHFAPTAIALITTEEIPSTVRRLAEAAGIYVFAASDLYHVLSANLSEQSAKGIRNLLRIHQKHISTLS